MNKIEVYRTHIRINDYTVGSCIALENCFTIYDPITHDFYYEGLYYDEESRTLFIPRGVDIPFIEKRIGAEAVFIEGCDKFDVFNNIQLKYFPRDNVQKQALQFMIGVDKYERNQYLSQLSVNLNTGKGKTYCSIATIAYIGARAIIIAYSTKWLQQWKEFILEYTDTRPEEICMMISSSKISRTMKEKNKDRYKFILTSHSSIGSYAKNNGWESIGKLFRELKIGIKIYDESHLNFKSMYMIDYFTNTWKTYYVTATPLRSNKDENKIYQLYMKNVPGIDLFNQNEDPHTHYIAIRYNSQPPLDILQKCKNQYGLDRNKYVNYIVHNQNFYKMLRLIMNMIINKGGKTLIYIGTIQAIDIVYEWIIHEYPEFEYNTCILTSEVVDKEIILKNQIILSTTKSAGTAMDIPFLQRTVILAEPFKSEILARQTLGRTRANNTEYVEVVDTGFKMINKWFLTKKPIFKKYALSCKIINVSNRDLDNMSDKIITDRQAKMLIPKEYKNVITFHGIEGGITFY